MWTCEHLMIDLVHLQIEKPFLSRKYIFFITLQCPGRIIWWHCLGVCVKSHCRIPGSCFPGICQRVCLFHLWRLWFRGKTIERGNSITWEDEEWHLGLGETRGKISFLTSAGCKNNQTHTKAMCPVHGKDKQYNVMSQTREVCWKAI